VKKILTADEMREVDRRTMEMGIPGIVLMENAALRVVEFLASEYAPVREHRVVVLCGKGNNGGDGLAIARQIHTRFRPRSLHVLLAAAPEDLRGDAAANYRMFRVAGGVVEHAITPAMRAATLIVDALLGTGLTGPATGRALEWIREMNTGFPSARIVAVDVPSGMPSDSASSEGEVARADATVTFTALKVCHALPPNCDRTGRVVVGEIGSPASLMEDILLAESDSEDFTTLFEPRPRGGHKGTFGHVLVIAGGLGKMGAAALTGMAAVRAGAGLVTVASTESAVAAISAAAPEMMTEPLPETAAGTISFNAFEHGRVKEILKGKTVVALGPGMSTHPETAAFVRRLVEETKLPMVIDADGLNCLAGTGFHGRTALRVITPHPGEMARLIDGTSDAVQRDRVRSAREFATSRCLMVVLKGQRTLVALPGGEVFVNPTGTPALATGGAGDILTGLIAGLLAQFPNMEDTAVRAGVYLHGLAAEAGEKHWGEKSLAASDLLDCLPEAMRVCQPK
jgi:NAD(P)H-hydrate epimerase